MLKKWALFLLTIGGFCNLAYGTHRYGTNASNIQSGTLGSQFLDSSSVTKRGQLTDGTQGLIISSLTVTGTITSTSGLSGLGSGLLNVSSLNATGVIAGTYGSGTLIPQFTLLSDGRISSAGVVQGSNQLSSTNTAAYGLNVIRSDGSTISIRADQLNIMGDYYNSVATTCDISRVGQGALDTGVKAPNTWYKYFAISNGSTSSVILSLSSNTQPNPMPAGYTKWRPLGYVRVLGDSTIRGFEKLGNWVQTVSTGVVIVDDADASNSPTIVSLANAVSTRTVRACFMINATETGNASSINLTFLPTGTQYKNNNINGTQDITYYIIPNAANDQNLIQQCYTLGSNQAITYNDNGTSISALKIGVFSYQEEYP